MGVTDSQQLRSCFSTIASTFDFAEEIEGWLFYIGCFGATFLAGHSCFLAGCTCCCPTTSRQLACELMVGVSTNPPAASLLQL
jgi:hypothetical protein